MRKFCTFLVLFFGLSLGVFAANKAILLQIDGPISPASLDYIQRGVDDAIKDQASIIILKLNTPGGLETTTREINKIILASPIPFVSYVSPSGARAASAGTFIVYASHLAVMAPGTNIGAASPINLFSKNGTNESKNLTTEDKKAINDAAAYLRSLAQLRGRNAEWAVLAVEKAATLSATEAKQLNVINDIAENTQQLLQKINGKTVSINGQPKQINTQNITITERTPDWRYHFLAFLTNPNIAYLLMLLALYGLFFELSNPGLVLPGVAGVIALLLVLYAFQLMPVNYTGLGLIFIGISFMIIEVYFSTFGVVGIGGVIAFLLGSVLLFDIQNEHYRIAWSVLFFMAALTFAFFFMVVSLVIKSHKLSVVTGKEGLIGSEGEVLNVMNRQIVVQVLGEIWEANSRFMLNRGDKIKVTAVKGLNLTVEPIERSIQSNGDNHVR